MKRRQSGILATVTIIIFIAAITFNALANIFIKASSLGDEKADPVAGGIEGILKSTLLNFWFMGGLACFGLALVAYKYVLGKGVKLSTGYPIMTSCGFAIVLLASRYFFHESLNGVQWAGIGLLVVGIWMIASQM